MQIHNVEIVFHEPGTTKNLDLMMSLFADDSTITSGGKLTAEWIRSESIGSQPGPFNPEPVGGVHAGFSHQIFR
jgi:hypothetical protein